MLPEGAIYGRFGYGIAARHAHLTARRPVSQLAAPPPAGDPPRAGPAAGHVEHMRAVHERVRAERPGMIPCARETMVEDRALADPSEPPPAGGPTALRTPRAGDGVAAGYAIYRHRFDFDDGSSSSKLEVRRGESASTPAGAVATVALPARHRLDGDDHRRRLVPPDHPLFFLLTSPAA